MAGRGRPPVDLTGQRFGRLVVLERAGEIFDQARHAYWLCCCDCGEYRTCRGAGLRAGYHLSCGCWRRENSGARAKAHKGAGQNRFAPLRDAVPLEFHCNSIVPADPIADAIAGAADWRDARRRLRALGYEVKQYDGAVRIDGVRTADPRLYPNQERLMSFFFEFSHNVREKLHELADRQLQYPHVPKAAVDFVKHAIDEFPAGTMLHVTAQGHKAQVDASGYSIPAAMDVKVTPIHLTE